MNCEQFRNEVFDSPSEERSKHAGNCSKCANLQERIQGEKILISKAFTPDPPGDLWARIQIRLQGPPAVPRIRIVSWISVAAALLLTVCGVLLARKPAEVKREPSLQLNIVEVSPEKSRSLSGFVPGYDPGDSRQALATAVVPFNLRRNR